MIKHESLLKALPLQGERISLTAFEESDLTGLIDFFQDMSALTYYIPTTARPLNSFQIKSLLQDWNDGIENFVFAVRHQGQLIGLVNLDGLDWANSHAEVGIALTAPAVRGQGLAFEALDLLLDFTFMELGLHRVWARIIEDNNPSLRLFARAGFAREGTLRQHVRRRGRFRDMHVYSILSAEWQTRPAANPSAKQDP